jgi:hypothetical protein
MAWALRDVINEFLRLYGDLDINNNKLIDIEWSIIRVIKEFLKKLIILIKACESKELILNLSLLYTNYILSLFKKHKDTYKDDPIFVIIFNLG